MNELLKVGWSWYPSVVMGFSFWTLLYAITIQRNRSRPTPAFQQAVFHLGTLVGLLALVSPLDELGDEYLFSAHMLQHLLLMFAVAPLWLIGTPAWLVDKIIPQRFTGMARRATNPAFAFMIFAGIMLFWHIPFFYEIAQEHAAVHIVTHLTYIGAGLIGWWPIAGARTPCMSMPRPPIRILYIFLLGIPCTALAAVLTFASVPLYPFYAAAPHPFGLDVLQDQQLGGLLMWIPAHMIFFAAATIVFVKWFAISDHQSQPEFADISS